LSESGSTGSASTASRDEGVGLVADQDLAGSAAASSRAAVFTASPVTRPKSVDRRRRAPRRCSRRSGRRADAVVAFELAVEASSAVAHVGRGADRAERVVLVQLRDAEHRHHGVPDELLDGSSVAFERARIASK
jgi:hypothetical protein